ncbi:hypothetical protein SDC9_104925 [bioreactor metagenome]|uniref:Uncharacterized protein n=1 Tax=bioreactor metagenome TaxID=1076179 RepID=A0A645AZ72_9ZZZZ
MPGREEGGVQEKRILYCQTYRTDKVNRKVVVDDLQCLFQNLADYGAVVCMLLLRQAEGNCQVMEVKAGEMAGEVA